MKRVYRHETIHITVVDADGVVLDSINLQVSNDTNRIAYRPLHRTTPERADEQVLEIGWKDSPEEMP